MFDEALKQMVEDELNFILSDEDVRLEFPWGNSDGWGGPAQSPLTVYIADDDKVMMTFDLRKSLSGGIKDCAEDGSNGIGLMEIRDAFRALADEIDAAVAKARERGAELDHEKDDDEDESDQS